MSTLRQSFVDLFQSLREPRDELLLELARLEGTLADVVPRAGQGCNADFRRRFEGHLRSLGREMTQGEVVRAIKTELNAAISQSYLSLIENNTRPHLSDDSRQLLARFFRVHPGYLVSDPPGFQTTLGSARGG